MENTVFARKVRSQETFLVVWILEDILSCTAANCTGQTHTCYFLWPSLWPQLGDSYNKIIQNYSWSPEFEIKKNCHFRSNIVWFLILILYFCLLNLYFLHSSWKYVIWALRGYINYLSRPSNIWIICISFTHATGQLLKKHFFNSQLVEPIWLS